jgi:hypothetical protein
MNAKGARLVRTGDDATATLTIGHRYRQATQLWEVALLNGGKKRVHVDVNDRAWPNYRTGVNH